MSPARFGTVEGSLRVLAAALGVTASATGGAFRPGAPVASPLPGESRSSAVHAHGVTGPQAAAPSVEPVSSPGTNGSRPRVVVLGGGFAGIGAAQKLHKSDVDVVVIDKHDYHTFQPLLYQVATGLLEQPAVGHPIRDLFDKQQNARVHQDEVTAVDLDAREVRFAELEPLGYDYLVLGLGAEVNFFGVEGAPEHAFPMYTLPDALRLKDHVLKTWKRPTASRNESKTAR